MDLINIYNLHMKHFLIQCIFNDIQGKYYDCTVIFLLLCRLFILGNCLILRLVQNLDA